MTSPSYYTPHPHRSLLSHLSIGVLSMPLCEPFYTSILFPLGISQIYRSHPTGTAATTCGWGYGGAEVLTLFESPEAAPPGKRTHLAFNAPSRAAVRAFYAAALLNGGTGDGEPGVRGRYGENYYACFVVDPEGWRVEAVFQGEVGEGEE